MLRFPGFWRVGFVVIGGLWLCHPASAADAPTITVTHRTAIETLSAGGDVTGVTMVAAGAHYTLVNAAGPKLVVQDAQGVHYRLAPGATDYVPAPTSPALSSSPAPAVPTPTPASQPAKAPVTPAASSSTPAVSDDTLNSINKAMGKPFFTAQNFWKESSLLIANRLGLKLEDKTKWETAYRRYFYDEQNRGYAPVSVLGGGAYCIALYADANDAPTSALIAFANDGDYQDAVLISDAIYRLMHPSGAPDRDTDKKIADLQEKFVALKQSFEGVRHAEEVEITQNLTTLFGDPQRTTFGSDATTRENVLRWDWNGVSFLLTGQENKYNLLRIIPTELADNQGRTERIPRDEMAAKLSEAVEHRPNGDVVITQIPMADQGLKGYCVPATWERVLRYTGVPGDMYTLSRIGNTGFGGGAWGPTVAAQLDDTLHNYGRRAEFITIDKLDAISLHRYIDKGIPVFWALNPGGYDPARQRYALLDRNKDWDQWKKLLEQSRRNQPPPLREEGGHQVLITGYNPETKEIAWSDPWGREMQERWMTQEEAERCTLGQYYLITW